MNLQQDKLTKSEWNSIEVPNTESEKKILNLIIKGFNNVNYIENKAISLFSYLKLKNLDNMNEYIFMKFKRFNYKKKKIIYKGNWKLFDRNNFRNSKL